jgi:TPR repeat protein
MIHRALVSLGLRAPRPSAAARVDLALAEFARAEASARATAVPPTATDASLAPQLALSDEQLAASASGAELLALGGALFAGQRVPRDLPRASQLWLSSARKGHAGGMLAVALASATAGGVGDITESRARAKGMLELLSVEGGGKGLPAAQYALGVLLLSPLAGPRLERLRELPIDARVSADAVRALSLFRAAADSKKVPPAALNAGACLLAGVGTVDGAPDVAAGTAYLRGAAAAGDALAAAELAARAPPGSAEAVELTRAAAAAGHPGAMLLEGLRLLASGPAHDLTAARVWLERAADAGVFRAAVNAALIASRGDAATRTPPDAGGAALRWRQAESIARKAGAPSKTVDTLQARAAAAERGDLRGDGASLPDGAELELEFVSTEARDSALAALREGGVHALGVVLGGLADAGVAKVFTRKAAEDK